MHIKSVNKILKKKVGILKVENGYIDRNLLVIRYNDIISKYLFDSMLDIEKSKTTKEDMEYEEEIIDSTYVHNYDCRALDGLWQQSSTR